MYCVRTATKRSLYNSHAIFRTTKNWFSCYQASEVHRYISFFFLYAKPENWIAWSEYPPCAFFCKRVRERDGYFCTCTSNVAMLSEQGTKPNLLFFPQSYFVSFLSGVWPLFLRSIHIIYFWSLSKYKAEQTSSWFVLFIFWWKQQHCWKKKNCCIETDSLRAIGLDKNVWLGSWRKGGQMPQEKPGQLTHRKMHLKTNQIYNVAIVS